MLQKAAYLCLAVVVATALAAPIALFMPWGIKVGADWAVVVLFHVAFVCVTVALYRRWRPRVNAPGGDPH